jgi:hypothetical protein
MVRAEITAQTRVAIETKDKRFPGWRWTADSPDFLRIEPPQSENAYQRWEIVPLPGGFFAVRSVVTGSYVNFNRIDHEFMFTSELGRTSEWSFDRRLMTGNLSCIRTSRHKPAISTLVTRQSVPGLFTGKTINIGDWSEAMALNEARDRSHRTESSVTEPGAVATGS